MVLKCGQGGHLIFIVIVLLSILKERLCTIQRNNQTNIKLGDADDCLKMLITNKYSEKTEDGNIDKDDATEVPRKKAEQGESIMEKVLPSLILPFLVSSLLIPAMLFSIKILLVKSAIIGKIAVILMLLNFFRRRSNQGGVYDHYPHDLAKEHYGYQGVEEPGIFINRRRRKYFR